MAYPRAPDQELQGKEQTGGKDKAGCHRLDRSDSVFCQGSA
jgi:hypothetical protein